MDRERRDHRRDPVTMADTDSGADDDSAAAADDIDDDTVADSAADDRAVIRTGRDFEQAYRLDAAEAGSFLIDMGEQLRDADDLTISTDEWTLPFAFGEPVELEIDFDGVDEPELEIELELPGRTDESAPDVE